MEDQQSIQEIPLELQSGLIDIQIEPTVRGQDTSMRHYGDDELNETVLANARFSQDIIAGENKISKEEFTIGAASEEVIQIEKTPLEKL